MCDEIFTVQNLSSLLQSFINFLQGHVHWQNFLILLFTNKVCRICHCQGLIQLTCISIQWNTVVGHIPMRRLVYRVQALPQSMLPLVWDFGQLSDDVEKLYIKQIVQRHVSLEMPESYHTVNSPCVCMRI